MTASKPDRGAVGAKSPEEQVPFITEEADALTDQRPGMGSVGVTPPEQQSASQAPASAHPTPKTVPQLHSISFPEPSSKVSDRFLTGADLHHAISHTLPSNSPPRLFMPQRHKTSGTSQ
jgi:hypothetical protein